MPPNVVPGRPGPATVARTRRQAFVRALIGAIALVVAALAGLVPAALAGPPVGTSGGYLEVIPANGRAAADVNAAYWYVDPFGGPCPATVTFLWDAKPVKTVVPPAGWNCNSAPLSFSFAPPTKTTTSHRVTACDPSGSCVTRPYRIDPTPTLGLTPVKGYATISFTAMYRTGQTTCGYPEAQFFWDGKAKGPRVPLDPKTCTAVKTFGKVPLANAAGAHRVSAVACSATACRPLPAARTFTVLAPPTPRPTATPTASATPAVTPSPTPEPSVPPSSGPSPSDVPRPTRPSATAEPSATPTPSPSPDVGTGVTPPVPPGTPPDGPNTYVPALVSSISAPEPGGIDSAVVATNLFLTLLVVFLFMLTAEVFNSTMDSNRDEVHGWWRRMFAGPLRLTGALNVGGSGLSRLAGSGRFASIGRVVAVLALLGLIYGFLSPDFGLNQQSAILVLSLVIGLGFLTYFNEASQTRLARRRYHATASVQLYGTAVVVAVVAVIVSRSMSFTPGLLYGFIASAVIVAPVALGKRDDALLVLVPASGLLVVSISAWLLLGPVRAAAADGAAAPALAESVLGMILVGGLEGLLFTMMPLTFLDGAAVMRWSRLGWALVFGTAVFLWWQLLLNHDSAYAAALEQTNVRIVLATLGVFMLTTGGLWSYFRFRPAPPEVETPA